MIERNVPLEYESDGVFSLRIDGPEIKALATKYDGVVSVRIGKPMTPGTAAQNRTAHALLTAFYLSGYASIPGDCTHAEFKMRKKLEYGPVYEFDYNGQVARIPKSFSDYSKEERCHFIDALVAEITQSGALAASDKLQEILKGMQENI